MIPGKIRPIKDVIFTEFGDEGGILVDLNSKQYYRLNETGSLIWRSLEKGDSVDDIVAKMQNAYDVSVDHARASVERLLIKLESNQLVQRL